MVTVNVKKNLSRWRFHENDYGMSDMTGIPNPFFTNDKCHYRNDDENRERNLKQ